MENVKWKSLAAFGIILALSAQTTFAAALYDSSADLAQTSPASTTNSWTVSVPTLTNGLAVVEAWQDDSGTTPVVTAATLGGQAMTVQSVTTGSSPWSIVYLAYLLGPPSGSQTLTITTSASHEFRGKIAFYSGINQTGQPDVTYVTSNGTSATASATITTVTSGDMIAGVIDGNNSALTAGNGTHLRLHSGNMDGVVDTGTGSVPAGSRTLSATLSSDKWGMILDAFVPAASSASSSSASSIPTGTGSLSEYTGSELIYKSYCETFNGTGSNATCTEYDTTIQVGALSFWISGIEYDLLKAIYFFIEVVGSVIFLLFICGYFWKIFTQRRNR